MEDSPICLFNLESQQYLKVCQREMSKKVLGFRVMLADTIGSDSIFYAKITKSRFVLNSKQIFTTTDFKLVLNSNYNFKVDMREEFRLRLQEGSTYAMMGSYHGCDISFLKQNILDIQRLHGNNNEVKPEPTSL